MPMPLLEHPLLMLPATLILSWFIVTIVIPVVIRVSQEKHLMEEPNGRSSHRQKTPSLGGVAIFAAVAIVFTASAQWISPANTAIIQLLPSLVILFFIGLKDDILVIDPVKKLAAQLIASFMFIYLTGIRLTDLYGLFGIHELPYGLSVGATLFVFIVITNAYNLIDGIDGLAGYLGIIAAIAYGIYFFIADVLWVSLLCATLIGALIGFLRFNFSYSRKIFMGDSGSLIVGFILSVLSVKFIQFNESPNMAYISNAPTIAIAVLSIPLFDTLRVFGHRILRGGNPFSADRNHIHHLLVERGLTHVQASARLALTSGLVVVLCFAFIRQASTIYSFTGVLVSFVAYIAVAQRLSLVPKSKHFVQKRIAPAKSEPVRNFTQPQSASAAS